MIQIRKALLTDGVTRLTALLHGETRGSNQKPRIELDTKDQLNPSGHFQSTEEILHRLTRLPVGTMYSGQDLHAGMPEDTTKLPTVAEGSKQPPVHNAIINSTLCPGPVY